jgi:hypothetical protein
VVRSSEQVNYATLSRAGLAGDPRTVKGYVDACPYDLKAIEAEALRCTTGQSICRVDVRHAAEFVKK